MAIKRYKANADNTIVSTYQSNLSTRGTGSNAGQADILEIYSVYGRQSAPPTASQELSRILVNFPVADITSDRSAGNIPSSGSVKFYLRLFSAESSKTVPRDFKLVAQPVSHSWQEGDGLDLENYSDLTKNGTGSNWINAGNLGDKEVSKVQFVTTTSGDLKSTYVTLYDSYRKKYAFYFTDATGGDAPDVAPYEVDVELDGLGTTGSFANKFRLAVLSSSANVTASWPKGGDGKTYVKVANKIGGAVTAAARDATLTDSELIVSTATSGSGAGPWRNVGGDYLAGGRSGASKKGLTFTQRFSSGLGDVEIDITKLVERWAAGTNNKYGIGVRLSASYEASASKAQVTADSNVIKNYNGAVKSYYTKRFFARGSQYFFKRPCIEARWNSIRKDDRGDFYYSSSVGTGKDNLNTLYLYNYVRGRLRNIPSVGTGKIYMRLYSGSKDNSKPYTTPLRLHVPASRSATNTHTAVTGGYYKRGIYTASVCLTKSAAKSISTLYDVWFKGTSQFFTGTITPDRLSPLNHAREPVYYLNITNLANSYLRAQNARFNLYIRNKYWDPTIYTKANNNPLSTTILSASYRVIRTFDNLEVIPHNTGSDLATGLSYDVSGNYFNFDMAMLEPGYEYAFKFAFYDVELGSWQEQTEEFKFRVNKNEH